MPLDPKSPREEARRIRHMPCALQTKAYRRMSCEPDDLPHA